MKTLKYKMNMKHILTPSLHVCGCCKRELPVEAFYMNKRTHAPESYCKECKKTDTKKRRERQKNLCFENNSVSYPVIFEVKDPIVRMSLIQHACRVVAESISRKQKKEKLRELWEE